MLLARLASDVTQRRITSTNDGAQLANPATGFLRSSMAGAQQSQRPGGQCQGPAADAVQRLRLPARRVHSLVGPLNLQQQYCLLWRTHLNQERLPLIPSELLDQHIVNEPGDTRYRAAARMLQSIWRAQHNLPVGPHIAEDGTVRDLGSRLTREDARKGANFLSRDLARLARYESVYREQGAIIEQERLWSNMLSSQALCFNLFGELKQDREKATHVCRLLWPELIGSVDDVLFEHSPGRGSKRFTTDGTAFDVTIVGRTPDGRRSFVGIEVKYTESMTEPPAPHRLKYDELCEATGLFKDAASPDLRAMPLQQLWREHLLSRAMLREGLYDLGLFVVVHPRRNQQTREAVTGYKSHLAATSPLETGFDSATMEQVLEARSAVGDAAFATAFHERYLDIERVEKLIFDTPL
jgi:hypothetical protein